MINNSVCLVTNLSLAEEPTIENRLTSYVNVLDRAGVRVSLISSDKRAFEFSGPNSDSVEHHLVPLSNKSRSGKSNFLNRAFFEFNETRKIIKRIRDIQAKNVIVSIPSMFLLFNIRNLKGVNVTLDVRDITWEYLSDKSVITFIAKRLFRLWAKFCLRKIQNVVVTNHMEEQYFASLGIPAYLCYNGVSKQQYNEITNRVNGFFSEKFTVTYCGKVGVAQKLDVFIETAIKLPEVNFVVVGYGPDEERLRNKAIEIGATNVYFTGKVGWDEVLEYYSQANILYAQLDLDYLHAVPSKLYQYLCTGKYVVFGGDGAGKELLSKFTNNTVVRPNDVDSLFGALEHLHLESKYTPQFSLSNRELILKSYIRENNVEVIVRDLL
ncbi:glycosyltransferase [Vibrio cyclitrophicus]